MKPTIIIVLAGGCVQDVISDAPLNYLVADADEWGCHDNELCEPPPVLAEALHSDCLIERPRHCPPATINAEAVAAMMKLHDEAPPEE